MSYTESPSRTSTEGWTLGQYSTLGILALAITATLFFGLPWAQGLHSDVATQKRSLHDISNAQDRLNSYVGQVDRDAAVSSAMLGALDEILTSTEGFLK